MPTKRTTGLSGRTRAQLESLVLLQGADIDRLAKANIELKTQLQAKDYEYQVKNDLDMMRERVKLASSLGQLVEAVSKAVVFVISKEAL